MLHFPFFWTLFLLFDQLFYLETLFHFSLKFVLSMWNFLILGNFLKSGIFIKTYGKDSYRQYIITCISWDSIGLRCEFFASSLPPCIFYPWMVLHIFWSDDNSWTVDMNMQLSELMMSLPHMFAHILYRYIKLLKFSLCFCSNFNCLQCLLYMVMVESPVFHFLNCQICVLLCSKL